MRSATNAVVLLLVCCTAAAQSLNLDPGSTDNHPPTPVVWYQRVWPDARPQNVSIVVDVTGQGLYSSSSRITAAPTPARSFANITQNDGGTEQEVKQEFTLSPENVKLVFASAERLRYFDGDFAYKKKVASTGAKTLTYADATRHFSTTYDASMNRDVDALTHFFGGISSTIEFGERLKLKYRHDKLGLNEELTGMDDASRNGWLEEVQIVAPLLKTLANDPSVLHMARLKAAQILARAGIKQ